MINTKRPNTSDYIQVGFIEAKDTQGNYQNIDHIYDSQGNIVFQQGYLNEYQGADNFSIPAIGKPLLDYTIYGNMSQASGVSPTTPIQPSECGELETNLAIISGDSRTIENRYYTDVRISDVLETGTYTVSYVIDEKTGTATTSSVGFGSLVAYQKDFNSFTVRNVPITITATVTLETAGCLWARFLRAGSPTDFSYSVSHVRVEKGSHSYGYKIPISSGGVNLAPPLTDWVDGYISSGNGGVHVPTETREKSSDFIRVEPNSVYVFSYENGNFPSGDSGAWRVAGLYDANKQFISRVGSAYSLPLTITTTAETVYIRLSFRTYGGSENAMLNLGSTPLPYEPYNRTTTPVYLGEVETTRKIKKLVLTGEEGWQRTSNGAYYLGTGVCPNDYLKTLDETIVVCTHYTAQKSVIGSSNVNNNCISFFGGSGLTCEMYIGARDVVDTETFKTYLAQQYAAETPVTVWYVLATPTTGMVNEPLRKIGDYADTLSMEQAGVEIPTIKGNTVIDVLTEVEPSEVDVTYRGSTKPKYNLFLAQNGDSFEAKDGQSLYIGGGL